MTDAKKVLTPKCKEQIWTRADIDKLAYDFWAIHPQELDAWYKGDMPTGFKGGVRAWYFASKIRAALTAATERAEKAEAERDALKADRDSIIRGAMLLEQKLKAELSDAVAKVAKYEITAVKEMLHRAEADKLRKLIPILPAAHWSPENE